MKKFYRKATKSIKDILYHGKLYTIGTDDEIRNQEKKMPEHMQDTVCFCTMLETFSCLPAVPAAMLLASPYADKPSIYASYILGAVGLSFLGLADGISRVESEDMKVGVGSGLVGKIRETLKKHRLKQTDSL